MLRFLFGLFTILVLAAGGILLLLENPDRFKPQITTAAKSATGYEVKIDGELSWRYWPPVAINVSDIQVSAPGNVPFASFENMSIDVDLMPLLMQQTAIDINEILLVGGVIDLRVDQDGSTNWEANQSASTPSETGDQSEQSFSTTVQQLAVDGLVISYIDQQAETDISVTLDNLVTSSLAPDVPFDISATFTVDDRKQKTKASISTTGQLLYKADSGNVNFNDLITTAEVAIEGESYPPISLNSTGEWRANEQELVLAQNNVQVSAINLTTQGVVFLAGEEPRFGGPVELDIANPAQLEQDLDISLPVQFLQLKTDVTASPSQFELVTLEGQFDESIFSGTFLFKNDKPQYFKTDLRIDQLDTSRYLASEGASTTSVGNRQDPVDSQLIPFELIRPLTTDNSTIRIDQLIHDGEVFDATKVTIRNLHWTLVTTTNTNAYDGKLVLHSNSKLKEGGETTIRLSLDKLDASQIIGYEGFTGRLSGNANLSFTGSYLGELSDTLTGKSTFNIADGTLDVTPIKNLAATIERIRGKPSPISQWPDVMPFKRMVGQHNFNQGTRQGQVFNAEFENLQIAALGGFDLVDQTLDYDVSAMFKAPKAGQFDVGEELIGIRWPMKCDGHFGDEPANLCFGKEGAITDLVADIVKQELKRQGSKKLQEALEDKIPEEYRQLTDDLLKNLFD